MGGVGKCRQFSKAQKWFVREINPAQDKLVLEEYVETDENHEEEENE